MLGLWELNLVLVLVTVVAAYPERYSAELYDREYVPYFESRGRMRENSLDRQSSLSAIRSLVNDLETREVKKRPYGGLCVGGGLSPNCEFNDVKEALNHVDQISSGHFPGRRKRSTFARFDGN